MTMNNKTIAIGAGVLALGVVAFLALRKQGQVPVASVPVAGASAPAASSGGQSTAAKANEWIGVASGIANIGLGLTNGIIGAVNSANQAKVQPAGTGTGAPLLT